MRVYNPLEECPRFLPQKPKVRRRGRDGGEGQEGGGAKRAATGNGAAHRSNGLPVRVVGHVARREHPSDGCRSGSRIGQLQVSVGVLHGGEGRRCFLGRERLPFSAVLLPEVCTMASSAKKPVFGMCPTWSKVANLGHDIASGHSSRCPDSWQPRATHRSRRRRRWQAGRRRRRRRT